MGSDKQVHSKASVLWGLGWELPCRSWVPARMSAGVPATLGGRRSDPGRQRQARLIPGMEASVRGAGRGAGRMQERKALSVRLRAREVIWALEASAWQVGPVTGGRRATPPRLGW